MKNRLVGDAEMDKGLFNRVSLKAADGVKYFLESMRPHFVKEDQDVFLWRLSQYNQARRGSLEMIKWIGSFF